MAIRFDRTALERHRKHTPPTVSEQARRSKRDQKLSGLTVSELAARARLSRQTVSILERARGAPRADTLGKLAQALGVSVTDFYVNGS